MKNLLFVPLVLCAAAMFASSRSQAPETRPAPSPARASLQRVQATIPFEFRAGNTVLPAGTYVLGFDSVRGTGWIQSVEQGKKVLTTTDYVPSEMKPKLQFKRDGRMMVLQATSPAQLSGNLSHRTGLADLAPGR